MIRIYLLKRGFSVYTNQLYRPFDYVNGQKVIYDSNIDTYEPIIQAYLTKRRLEKPEIS